MKLKLNLKKSIQKNAEVYFEKSKKMRKKIEGVKEALERFNKQKKELEKKQFVEEKKKAEKTSRKKIWYEKFRWFISSEGFLCIGGRDATSNEIVIKKHTDADDLVFHTEAPGSPFFVIKTEGKKPTEKTLQEVAQATASFSRGWKLRVGSMEVYHIKPEQVSKQAKSGEYLAKGAFMIYGKRTYYNPSLEVAVGVLDDGRIMSGPLPAVKANCKKFVIVKQGDLKASDMAKKIIKQLGTGTPDEVIPLLPSGGMRIAKR